MTLMLKGTGRRITDSDNGKQTPTAAWSRSHPAQTTDPAAAIAAGSIKVKAAVVVLLMLTAAVILAGFLVVDFGESGREIAPGVRVYPIRDDQQLFQDKQGR